MAHARFRAGQTAKARRYNGKRSSVGDAGSPLAWVTTSLPRPLNRENTLRMDGWTASGLAVEMSSNTETVVKDRDGTHGRRSIN